MIPITEKGDNARPIGWVFSENNTLVVTFVKPWTTKLIYEYFGKVNFTCIQKHNHKEFGLVHMKIRITNWGD